MEAEAEAELAAGRHEVELEVGNNDQMALRIEELEVRILGQDQKLNAIAETPREFVKDLGELKTKVGEMMWN